MSQLNFLSDEMNELDWGVATPEGYDFAKKEALHVLNVKLIGDINRNRVIKFICARILYFARHLPSGSSQRVVFDLRGQRIGNKKFDMRQTIIREVSKNGIPVVVEFLGN